MPAIVPRAVAVLCAAVCIGLAAYVSPAAADALSSTSRVVNGWPAKAHDTSSLVALLDRKIQRKRGTSAAFVCGGTLVSPTLVVTAAHCVLSDSFAAVAPESLLVGFAADNARLDRMRKFRSVVSVKVHPGYDAFTIDSDVAVLELDRPMPWAHPMQVVLPQDSDEYERPGALAKVAGWGVAWLEADVSYPQSAHAAHLTVFPRASCGAGLDYSVDGITFAGYPTGEADPSTMLCAQGVRAGAPSDTCFGDSGGPLLVRGSLGWRLVGVVSWGEGSCAGRFPGVYTRLSGFSRFLELAGVPLGRLDRTSLRSPHVLSATHDGVESVRVSAVPHAAGREPRFARVVASWEGDGASSYSTCRVRLNSRRPFSCTLSGVPVGAGARVEVLSLRGLSVSPPSEAFSVT